jgi:hypothetical protein
MTLRLSISELEQIAKRLPDPMAVEVTSGLLGCNERVSVPPSLECVNRPREPSPV